MYLALYRKYRPKNFDEVVGQQSVIKILKNAIKYCHINHAYMFSGPRGTGKTSIAKIFARSINCLEPLDGKPCEICNNCIISREKNVVDIIEIDAASNNGVDEIRELRNNVNIVPSELKYKVYIIDEVHMLSNSAFNALLKTLEEPPAHAIFILATTDPQKVPDTIVSRCQCYEFQRISGKLITKQLKRVCELEKINVNDNVFDEIVKVVDGGLRDSLGILDKLSSYSSELITVEDFYEINGLISKEKLLEFESYILSGDNSSLLNLLEIYNNNGKNIVQIVIQLLYLLKDELIDYYINGKKYKFDVKMIKSLANLINEKIFSIKVSSDPKIYVEIMLLNWMQSNEIISREKISVDKKDTISNQNKETVDKNIQQLNPLIFNKKINESNLIIEKKDNLKVKEELSNNVKKSFKLSNWDEIMRIRVNNTLAMADKSEVTHIRNNINSLKEFVFDQQIGYVASELLNAKIQAASKNIIILSYEYDSVVETNIGNIDILTEVFNKIMNDNKKLAIITDETWQREKLDFVKKNKSGIKYTIEEEPELSFNLEEEKELQRVENDGFSTLFGDIVVVE